MEADVARMLGLTAPKWADYSYCCGKHCPGAKAASRRRARASSSRRWRGETVAL